MRYDNTSRLLLIALIIVVSYFLFFSLLTPFFVKQPRTMYEMMQQMMNPASQTAIATILSVIFALLIGFYVSMKIKPLKTIRPRHSADKEKALRIVRKKLSDDEKKMLKEVERTGIITQDSLRARLGWSKAKVSTTLTRLDKMNLIQRERQGKTYKVFLSKDLR